MNKLAGLLLVVPVTSSAAAQVSSPSGFLSKEGNSASIVFGSLREGRFMLLDADPVGRRKTIKGISFRRDGRYYCGGVCEGGRTWSSVSVDYAPCDALRSTHAFSQFLKGTPTRVFSASITWPTLGPPTTSPAPWGGRNGRLTVPFRSAAVTGSDHLSFDFRFRGGSLANGKRWDRTVGFYALDMERSSGASNTASSRRHSSGKGCADSYFSGSIAGLSGTATAWGGSSPFKVEIRVETYLTAPGKPILHALGVAGSAAGVPLPGVSCNRLHIDPTAPHVVYSRVAWSSSPVGYARTLLTLPFRSAIVGTPVWAQAAWDDSNSAKLLLTNAIETSIPPMPSAYKNHFVYALGPDLSQAFSGQVSPIVRYTL